MPGLSMCIPWSDPVEARLPCLCQISARGFVLCFLNQRGQKEKHIGDCALLTKHVHGHCSRDMKGNIHRSWRHGLDIASSSPSSGSRPNNLQADIRHEEICILDEELYSMKVKISAISQYILPTCLWLSKCTTPQWRIVFLHLRLWRCAHCMLIQHYKKRLSTVINQVQEGYFNWGIWYHSLF